MDRALKQKLKPLGAALDERARRLAFAAEARALGRGGIEMVHRATRMARSTIARGIEELQSQPHVQPPRVRRPGGGRKRLEETDPALVKDLEALVEPDARGDPMSPLQWTLKSLRVLTGELEKKGHVISHPVVRDLLAKTGYGLQGNRKTKEGTSHPDHNAQFQYIHDTVLRQLKTGQPTISVDTKKKELVGDFKNGGREWRPHWMPEKVRVHDFIDEKLGKAIPYGVYDLQRNEGWVSLGVDHDTASFAVRTIARWWRKMGSPAYPNATNLIITADAGGSNGPRLRLWKWEPQRFADHTGLTIHVLHYPPGTSKWNKIEHRLFSFITMNWRGRPLRTLATMINLIGSTRTKAGLRVRAELDTGKYPTGREVSEEEMATVNLTRDAFHGDWNYTIRPKKPRTR